MGKVIGKGIFMGSDSVRNGALLNPLDPIPEGSLQFEGTEEYIFFEGQSAPDYITFETNE